MAKLTGKDLELCNEIKAVLAKYGYTVNGYNMAYTDQEARFTIKTTKPGVTQEDKYASTYKSSGYIHGLKPEWLGKEFTFNGRKTTLVGLHWPPRSRKPPQVVMKVEGMSGLRVTAPEAIVAIMERMAA